MSDDEIKKCFDLVKKNMERYYRDSEWGWDDKDKCIL